MLQLVSELVEQHVASVKTLLRVCLVAGDGVAGEAERLPGAGGRVRRVVDV